MDDRISDADLVEEIDRTSTHVDALERIALVRGWKLTSEDLGRAVTLLVDAAGSSRSLAKPRDPSARRGDFIGVFSGRLFYPMDPRPEDVDPMDIAHALSLRCRWGCMSPTFYSVAEHSLAVANVARHLAELEEVPLGALAWAYGLLHDANEAYLPDVPRPVKPFMPEWAKVEADVQEAIHARFSLPPISPEIEVFVRKADHIMLMLELGEMFSDGKYSAMRSWSQFHDVTITPEIEKAAREHLLQGFTFRFDWAKGPMLGALNKLLEEQAKAAPPTPKARWEDEVKVESSEAPEKYRKLLEG
jgi:hypothetical protein